MNAELESEIIIRSARQGDDEAILRCLAAAFEPYRSAYTAEAFSDTVLDPERLAVRLRQMHVLVAIAPEGVVGTIAGSLHGAEGHLRGMAVLPHWHKTGVAVKLLCAIEAWLRTNGCTRVTLDTTLPLHAAIKFYEKNGYRRSGTVSDFFGMLLVEYLKPLS
ncbi:MAG TPA: GNAT family N-acetyltransferase [Terriglobales bacterium]|nr:GNAT family N-acetyltransferase [Terriglobales bacterium]